MENVDEQGNVIAFSALRVHALEEKPLEVALYVQPDAGNRDGAPPTVAHARLVGHACTRRILFPRPLTDCDSRDCAPRADLGASRCRCGRRRNDTRVNPTAPTRARRRASALHMEDDAALARTTSLKPAAPCRSSPHPK